MRCPDCQKFVSFEQEVDDPSFDCSGTSVAAQIRIVLKCAECGNELKDTEIDFEEEIQHDCPKRKEDEEPEFDEVSASLDPADRYQSTDAKGKPIPARYQKHFYGAEGEVTVKCKHCEEEISVQVYVEEQARGFNELV